MSREREYLTDYINDQLRLRYAMFDRPRDGSSNLIIDSFAPKLLTMNQQDRDRIINDLPKTTYSISNYFSDTFQIRKLPFKLMLQTLNITDKHLKQLVLTVKRKNLNMALIGAGGTTVNTWHWLGEIAQHTGNINIFNKVTVFDEDTVDYTNILRFPIDINVNRRKYKTCLIDNKNKIAKELKRHNVFVTKPKNKYLRRNLYYPFKTRNIFNNDYVEEYVGSYGEEYDYKKGSQYIYSMKLDDNAFAYGAPDLETRQYFTEEGIKFISGTHGDNDCSLETNPTIDTNLQTESYGMIQLTTFFFNQLAMTIGLLEFLAKDDVVDDVNKWEEQGEFFKFSFSDFVNSGSNGKADRQLSFQVNHSGLIEDENQTQGGFR